MVCLLDIIFTEAMASPLIKVDDAFGADFKRLKDANNLISTELKKHPKFSRWNADS
jgi:hypothetical protein